MERRNFTRVVFHSEAVIRCKGFIIRGSVRNLSLSGLFIETLDKVPEENVDLTLFLYGQSSELFVNLKGKVVREELGGLAIQFVSMDLDSFLHLKNAVSLFITDHETLSSEFTEYMKFRE